MIRTLVQLLKTGSVTQAELFPELPAYSRGLPALTPVPCRARDGCVACVAACPTDAIEVTAAPGAAHVSLDRGACLACGACVDACPTGTIVADRRTTVATLNRAALTLTNAAPDQSRPAAAQAARPFRRSLHIREVSTGDSAADLEVAAANNPIFDSSRFGVHYVASPRFADALVVTGPVGLAMQEPLRRCYEAMAEPRLVIAVGAAAISGVPHAGGYAAANGVESILPVAAYVPGNPPHPWYILHGILLAMGHPAVQPPGRTDLPSSSRTR